MLIEKVNNYHIAAFGITDWWFVNVADDERNGRTIPSVLASLPLPTAGSMPSTGPSVETIIIIVVCTVMGAVVLVLIILAVLYWKNCLCKDKHQQETQLHELEQHREPFISMYAVLRMPCVKILFHSVWQTAFCSCFTLAVLLCWPKQFISCTSSSMLSIQDCQPLSWRCFFYLFACLFKKWIDVFVCNQINSTD